MNTFDRYQYYENFYDSFCSDFAIPRATTSNSYSRPSSNNNRSASSNSHIVDANFIPEVYQTPKRNGNSNHFYYYELFSDAFPQHMELESPATVGTPIEFCADERNCTNVVNAETIDMSFPSTSESHQPQPQSQFLKKKGPPPPPKPQFETNKLYDTSTFTRSACDLLKMETAQQMGEDGDTNFILNPSTTFIKTFELGPRSLHQSFESVASYPPPPPKHVRAPTLLQTHGQSSHHMSAFASQSTEALPSFAIQDHIELAQHQHHHQQPMSLSEFLKLSSNNVFKRNQMGTKHSQYKIPQSNSPTPSVSSAGQSRSSGSVLFRKKCGVTKRRKKIDESLFAPSQMPAGTDTASISSRTTVTGLSSDSLGQNKYNSHNANNTAKITSNLRVENAISPAPPEFPPCTAESSKYSITCAPHVCELAETNHDTEFELDPLPEKDCDEYDFNWTAPAQDNSVADLKKTRRKTSTPMNNTPGSRRPSSRCSLIINSLLGHFSGLTKTSQEPQQEEPSHIHQYSHNNNNNFTHLDHNHRPHVDDDGHHETKLGKPKKKSYFEHKKRFNRRISEHATNSADTLVSNKHNSDHITMNPHDDNGITGQLKKNRNSYSTSDMLKTSFSTSAKDCDADADPLQLDEHVESRQGKWLRPRSIAAFDLDIDLDAIIPFDTNDHDKVAINGRPTMHIHSQQNGRTCSPTKNPFRSAGRFGSKSLSNINIINHGNSTTHDSFPSLSNVIGCIPRVSLSNIKTRPAGNKNIAKNDALYTKNPNSAFNTQTQLKPQFAIGSNDTENELVSNHSTFEEMARNNHVGLPPQQRTCCRGGLFGSDPSCCDKFDKYYGQYSLTGLNIPNMYPYNDMDMANVTSAKSAEELVLDRYYSHCNKVVRKKEQKHFHPDEQGGKQRKSLFQGKRTYSLPEKLWKNVSLPLINSNNTTSSTSDTVASTALCGHHKARQIEECFYCLNEQEEEQQQIQSQHQHQYSNQLESNQKGRKIKDKKKTLMKTDWRDCSEHERDFGTGTAGRLIKLKKLGKNKYQREKNVQRFEDDVAHPHVHVDDGELSSSSSSSYCLSARVAKSKQKQNTYLSSACLNSTNSDEVDDFDSQRLHKVGQRSQSYFCLRNTTLFPDESEVLDEDDDLYSGTKGRGKLTVKVKAHQHYPPMTSIASNKRNANNPVGKPCSAKGYDGQGKVIEKDAQVKATQDVRKKRRPMSTTAFSVGGLSSEKNAARRVTAMNPIMTATATVEQRQDYSSTTISSLPATSSEEGDEKSCNKTGSKKNDGSGSNGTKRNRVKWMFLTSGLAKVTRKLSSSSTISSSDSNSIISSKRESCDDTEKSDCPQRRGRRNPSDDDDDKDDKEKVTYSRKIKLLPNATTTQPNCERSTAGEVRKKNPEVMLPPTSGAYFKERTRHVTNAPPSGLPMSQKSVRKANCTRGGEGSASHVTVGPTRTASLRRKPSYNTKKQRPISIQVVSRGGKHQHRPTQQHSLKQADAFVPEFRGRNSDNALASHDPSTSSVQLRQRVAPTRRTATVGSECVSNPCIFSATSTTSSVSSTSSTRSSSSGYTSNVSKRTSMFLKSFRKRFVKKNNKVADGDEKDAYRSQHDNDDDDNEDNNHYHINHRDVHKGERRESFGFLQRKKLTFRRSTSRASKAVIFSTFYTGPVITDPMEEEKLYVTKDFADVTLDLQSGEVKQTCDGTVLFTAEPHSFAEKQEKKKQKKEAAAKEKKKKREKKLQRQGALVKEDDDDDVVKLNANDDVDDVVGASSARAVKSSKKSNYIICHSRHSAIAHNDRTQMISGWDANSCASHGNTVGAGDGENKKIVKKKQSQFLKNSSKPSHIETAGALRKTNRGLIKSYLGISKDLRAKNQSAEDVSGGGEETIPDTPTRGSSGLLGRLRDSSRSGFGFTSSTSTGGNGGGSRSSSKKRSSSKHDTVNTQTPGGNGGGGGGFEVSQTDSPTQKSRNSLSDSLGARGNTDDADQEGVSGKLSTAHHHPQSSSEEELTSINSCDNRLSSLTLGESSSDGHGGGGEYNGPFQGRAVARVDCTPSAYDRHALRYKKGDKIDIIAKKPTGLWLGKVNNQIGYFKFNTVVLLPNASLGENYDEDNNHEDEDEIDGDDSVGDYADTSNYQCSLHNAPHPLDSHSSLVQRGSGECSCPPNDVHRSPGARQYRGNSKRLAGAITPWEVAEQRQSVANVINGYGITRNGSNKDKRQKQRSMYHRDPLGLTNAEHGEENEDEEGEQVQKEEAEDESCDEVDEENEDDDDEEDELEDELDGGGEHGQVLNQNQLDSAVGGKDVKCQVTTSQKRRPNKKKCPANKEKDNSSRKMTQPTVRKGLPTNVHDLLLRINLEKYTRDLENHGFESLDLLKELEEEDLDSMGILNPADRAKILTAVNLLREWDVEADRIPGQTWYQYKYYLTHQKTPKNARACVNAQNTVVGSTANNMSKVMGQGSPALQQQPPSSHTAMPSPHFYRLHHPRDSGIFVGKVDGEEDGDEPISGADLSCAESHPDVETEEIILSPMNLAKPPSVVTTGNPTAGWHHHNNNKQGSHHVNRFISKGAPGIVVGGSSTTSTNSITPVATAQQPTSSASSSGSSSSGIAATGDSFWQCASSNNSNGSSGSGTSNNGPGSSSIVVDQNHSQWNKQQQTRDASQAYNTDSVRNRFLQAKSLFETTNNCSSGTPMANNTSATGGKPKTPNHVYENGGDENGESQSHQLQLQRGGSQGKSLSQQQQQNRFLYCEKSSDSGISVCTNSPPPLRNEFRN